MIKSLHARHHELARQERQLQILNNGLFQQNALPTFKEKLKLSTAIIAD
jgi:hypothetical protein